MNSIEYCICGHEKTNHNNFDRKSLNGVTLVPRNHCSGCYIERYERDFNICEQFKLDNLKLIENLAKERNLV